MFEYYLLIEIGLRITRKMQLFSEEAQWRRRNLQLAVVKMKKGQLFSRNCKSVKTLPFYSVDDNKLDEFESLSFSQVDDAARTVHTHARTQPQKVAAGNSTRDAVP